MPRTATLDAERAGARPTRPGRRGTVRVLGLPICLAVLALTVLLSLALGAESVSFGTAWHALVDYDGGNDAVVVRHLRVPRTSLGLLVGAAMGLAGAIMQALTRNPLADPGILGVNAGASLAVVIAIACFGLDSLTGYVWFAMAGAAITSVVVYVIGSAGRAGANPARLALAGTAINAALIGVISTVVLLDLKAFNGFRVWSVGSLAGRSTDIVWQILPFMIIGCGVALAMGGPLNALALGDDSARSLGAKVSWIRLAGVIAVTLLCGAATAAVGPISFVGLVIPHIVRSFTGPNQRWMLPYCMLLGPILVLGADVIGRLVTRPGELEVGVVTAIVGAPVFVYIVRRRRLMQL